MKFLVLAFLAFMALMATQALADDLLGEAETETEDMVIVEAGRSTRETEDVDPEDESSREARQFFWGMGPNFPGGFIMQQRYVPGSGFSFAPFGAALGARVPVAPKPVVPVVPVAPVAPVAPVSQGQCYTTKGVSGQCTTYQNCGYYNLLEGLPKNLPSWALGTKDSCIVPNAKVDRMGVGSHYGLCCPSQQQTRVPQEPQEPQQPQQPLQPQQPPYPQRQWGGQGVYPAGSQPLYPGQGFQPGFGGFPFSPQGFGGGRPQSPPGFGGQPQGPPPGQGGFGGPPQGPPPGQGGFGGPPPGQGGQGFGGQGGQQHLPPGTPCNGNCPGFGGQGFGGQPQYPPPAQRPTTQRPTQRPTPRPTTQRPAVQPTKPAPIASVDDDISSSAGEDYSVCGKGRNPIKYNADGEEKEQVERIEGTHPLRVAGGWPADRNEWPWIVMMMNRGNQFCDGSIIDEYHILTAAHCVAQMRASDVTTLTVRMGAHNLKESAREAGVQNHGVKLVVKHKDFTMETLHSDIAILVLKTPITYTATIRPVCLPKDDKSYAMVKGTVAGWGLLREGGSRPVTLMELTMEIWDNQRCKTTYGSTAPAGITDSMLCAGKKGKDSCSGDSGGPFVTPEGDHWTQIGVVSWGIGCGKQHYPGVYTRVSKMMEWINKVRRLYPGEE